MKKTKQKKPQQHKTIIVIYRRNTLLWEWSNERRGISWLPLGFVINRVFNIYERFIASISTRYRNTRREEGTILDRGWLLVAYVSRMMNTCLELWGPMQMESSLLCYWKWPWGLKSGMNEGLLCSLCVLAFSFCSYNWKTEALFINIWIKIKMNDGEQFPMMEIWVEMNYTINMSMKAWISIKIPWHGTVTTHGIEEGPRRIGRQPWYSGTAARSKWFLFNRFHMSATLGMA